MHKVEHRLIHLDMLRGLAAIGVVLGHIRSFVVVDYGTANTTSVLDQAFYALTGLGHQCVIAFFALSGFLVGGSALRGILAGRWVWPRYIVRRITRLWVVLIPALMLTLGIDTAGQILGGHSGYDGAFYDLINSGPKPAEPADLSIGTIVYNLLFLQTILAPTLGSNGPLWSLANEFWYYIMFPFMLVGLIGRKWATLRIVMGAIGISLAALLPTEMVLLGAIWVAGAVAHYSQEGFSALSTQKARLTVCALGIIAVAGAVAVDKHWPGVAADLFLGAAFAFLLPALVYLASGGRVYDGISAFLAKISYTLYATHFPVLAFVWFVLVAPHKWTLGPAAAGVMISLFGISLAVAIGLWWLFERNTERVRDALESRLFVKPAI
jgi:peptidoglycan/LPS O-acetylase OafA/YrhL